MGRHQRTQRKSTQSQYKCENSRQAVPEARVLKDSEIHWHHWQGSLRPIHGPGTPQPNSTKHQECRDRTEGQSLHTGKKYQENNICCWAVYPTHMQYVHCLYSADANLHYRLIGTSNPPPIHLTTKTSLCREITLCGHCGCYANTAQEKLFCSFVELQWK